VNVSFSQRVTFLNSSLRVSGSSLVYLTCRVARNFSYFHSVYSKINSRKSFFVHHPDLFAISHIIQGHNSNVIGSVFVE
jgi:hypothetical protein